MQGLRKGLGIFLEPFGGTPPLRKICGRFGVEPKRMEKGVGETAPIHKVGKIHPRKPARPYFVL